VTPCYNVPIAMMSCVRLCLRVLLCAIFVAIGGCSGTPNGLGAVSSVGGEKSTGGTQGAPGGSMATGGSTNNSTVMGSGGGASCTTGTSGIPTATSCSRDVQCPSTQYCDTEHCGSSCSCVSGSYVCTDVCIFQCADYPTNCIRGTDTLASQLSGNSCTIMVRVNHAADQILSYSVNCGTAKPNTETDAYNQLSQMNSINWAGATSLGTPELDGLFAFAVSDTVNRYSAYFSTATGNELLLLQSSLSSGIGSLRSNVTWRDAGEFGTSCVTASVGSSVIFGMLVAEATNASQALSLLFTTGLIPTLRSKLGSITHAAVTYVNITDWQYLIFISAG
jgi:hypothetical protein